MKPWTEAAEMRLEQYLNERVLREQMHGEEAIELKEDLRRHIHEEVQGDDAIQQCGLMQLENALSRLDAGYRTAAVPSAVVDKPRASAWRKNLIWFFGVFFPLGVVIFEWLVNFCGGVFFDPIPTMGHGLLLLSVPILNAWLLKTAGEQAKRRWKWRALASGLSCAVGAFYSLLFLPLVPASLCALIAYGLGLLSLSPILAWLSTWKISVREKHLAAFCGATDFRRLWWTSLLVVFGLLCIYEVPGLWTRHQVERYLTSDSTISQDAVETLRAYHSEETLLGQCYQSEVFMDGGDIATWVSDDAWRVMSFSSNTGRTQDVNKVRDLYFKVTGAPFNAKRPPHWQRGSNIGAPRRNALSFESEFDFDHGGDAVASQIKYLDCKESRFDGHIDGRSRIGYGEWTLVFQNQGTVAREARCQIRLPHGGQVSRLTLWINGEPREAAFGSVAQVKAAYKEVAVVQRRDPVLVNMVGPDTFMVQCFPVPAKGEMKIRLGVTAPLEGDQWRLPRIIEKNFGLTDSLAHTVWMQSDEHFSCIENHLDSHEDGEIESLSFETKTMPMSFHVSEAPREMPAIWCEDRFAAPTEKILVAQPILGKRAAVDKCIVVVDGSYTLQAHREWISRELVGKNVSILLANDKSVSITAEAVAKHEFRGGCNNEPALYEALRLAKESSRAAVIWLHGPQPVEMNQTERILQLLERGISRPAFYEVPVVDGSNRLFEKLGRSEFMKSAPIQLLDMAESDHSLSKWIDFLVAGEDTINWMWSRRADATGLEGKPVSDQLARFWAMQKVAETKDSALAIKYQIVSPVSGAVVLENMEQYARHGLEPVDENFTPTVPNVPEPSSALLILLGAMMACMRRKR
jgi:hypothetical protein